MTDGFKHIAVLNCKSLYLCRVNVDLLETNICDYLVYLQQLVVVLGFRVVVEDIFTDFIFYFCEVLQLVPRNDLIDTVLVKV